MPVRFEPSGPNLKAVAYCDHPGCAEYGPFGFDSFMGKAIDQKDARLAGKHYCARHKPKEAEKVKSIEEMKAAKANCTRCAGTGWVCGEHRDKPWSGLLETSACGCNAPGDPCPDCNGLAKMSDAAGELAVARRQYRRD